MIIPGYVRQKLNHAMKYQEMTDFQWKTVEKHLSKANKKGRPRCDDYTTINGILYGIIMGCRW